MVLVATERGEQVLRVSMESGGDRGGVVNPKSSSIAYKEEQNSNDKEEKRRKRHKKKEETWSVALTQLTPGQDCNMLTSGDPTSCAFGLNEDARSGICRSAHRSSASHNWLTISGSIN